MIFGVFLFARSCAAVRRTRYRGICMNTKSIKDHSEHDMVRMILSVSQLVSRVKMYEYEMFGRYHGINNFCDMARNVPYLPVSHIVSMIGSSRPSCCFVCLWFVRTNRNYYYFFF